jgi:hypothetical protein
VNGEVLVVVLRTVLRVKENGPQIGSWNLKEKPDQNKQRLAVHDKGPAQSGLILDERLVGRANCASELDERLAR